jgi:hypothetical protein
MALVGLAEAARLTGKHPTTIIRAAARGRLSFSVNSAGQKQFDTAELDRALWREDGRRGQWERTPERSCVGAATQFRAGA